MACVIGSDAESVETLADVLGEFAAVEVDQLDTSRRSLDVIRRRDYGLVVIDSRVDDSLAFVNELTRRLGHGRRRDCTVLLCHREGPLTPSLEALVRSVGPHTLARPFDAHGFMQAVAAALGGEPADAIAS
jgi:hypothetical protein